MSIRLRAVLAFACVVACACAWAAPNKAPAVTLTAPTKGSSFAAPANITISANASDQDGIVTKVEFYQGTTLVGTRTTLPYSMVWTNVAGGTYSLTATATDNLGASKTSSAVSITVSGPKLLIASPANGATVYGGSAVVTGTFFGNANSTVLIDNGNTTRLAALSSNTYSATVPIYNGTNALRVVASRRDKSSDQASVVITGNTNPLLVFTAPTTAVGQFHLERRCAEPRGLDQQGRLLPQRDVAGQRKLAAIPSFLVQRRCRKLLDERDCDRQQWTYRDGVASDHDQWT